MNPSFESRSDSTAPIPGLFGRRIDRIEEMIRKFTAPDSSVKFVDRHTMRKTGAYCALSSELVDWMMGSAGFFNRANAVRYMQIMLEYGYLICLARSDRISDDNTLITVQAPNMYVNPMWSASEGDYSCYLLRRSRQKEDKIPLRSFEMNSLIAFNRK